MSLLSSLREEQKPETEIKPKQKRWFACHLRDMAIVHVDAADTTEAKEKLKEKYHTLGLDIENAKVEEDPQYRPPKILS